MHWQLSGEKVLGIGDASGMFPIDEQTGTYDAAMMEAFGGLDEVKRYPWKLADILPKPLRAGKSAGQLTKEGAWLLDPTGKLQPGALMAPPEAMPALAWSRQTPCASARATSRSARRPSR